MVQDMETKMYFVTIMMDNGSFLESKLSSENVLLLRNSWRHGTDKFFSIGPLTDGGESMEFPWAKVSTVTWKEI